MGQTKCPHLEAALKRMEVRDGRNKSGETANALSRRQKEAAAGDCVISHKCPHRRSCLLGVEQTWQSLGFSSKFLRQQPPLYPGKKYGALPSEMKSIEKTVKGTH